MSHLKKWVTLRLMGHTWKKGDTLNIGSQVKIWVTVKEVGHTCKNGSKLEYCVTSEKMGHTYRNE